MEPAKTRSREPEIQDLYARLRNHDVAGFEIALPPCYFSLATESGLFRISSIPCVRVFIVHAHHEPKSFNGALTQEAVATLESAGHECVVSDLYAMGFDPVSDRRNFTTVANGDYLRQQTEEIHASEQHSFAPDIQSEMHKLFWCDVLIFQFPLWWFGLPAILKGWVDRVFAMRRTYGGGKYYDRGVFAGKRAMCSLTTGGLPPAYSDRGMNGLLSSILFPINHGILYFAGFTVIEPFVVHGPMRLNPEERDAHLVRYRERVLGLASAPTIVYPKLAEYDEQWVLKPASRGPLQSADRS